MAEGAGGDASSSSEEQMKALQESLAKAQSQIEADKSSSRMLEAKINKLSSEKETLVQQALGLKERLSSENKTTGELRAIVAGMEAQAEDRDENEASSSLASATHKLVNLQQQNDALHQALKQAKEVCHLWLTHAV